MNDQIRQQQEQPQLTEQPQQVELDIGVVRSSSLSVARPVRLQMATEGTTTTWVEPEEVLIADPRGDLTPAELVDQKLLALLPFGHARLSRRHTLRRNLGEQTPRDSLARDI